MVRGTKIMTSWLAKSPDDAMTGAADRSSCRAGRHRDLDAERCVPKAVGETGRAGRKQNQICSDVLSDHLRWAVPTRIGILVGLEWGQSGAKVEQNLRGHFVLFCIQLYYAVNIRRHRPKQQRRPRTQYSNNSIRKETQAGTKQTSSREYFRKESLRGPLRVEVDLIVCSWRHLGAGK